VIGGSSSPPARRRPGEGGLSADGRTRPVASSMLKLGGEAAIINIAPAAAEPIHLVDLTGGNTASLRPAAAGETHALHSIMRGIKSALSLAM
jgi:hypothetical protein